MFIRLNFIVIIACVLLTGTVHAQLRVVEYNTAGVNSTTALETIFEAIGAESINGISKPIDALLLQEQNSTSGDTQTILNGLLAHYGPGSYARSTVNGGTTGAGTQTLIYNTQTLQLINEKAFGTTGSTGAARQDLRFEVRPVGYDSSADIFMYNSHYKASDDTTDANRRNVEAQAVRADAATLPAGADVIYAGDYNIYRSSEPMWATLTQSSTNAATAAIDPINQVGSWSNNAAFKAYDTQSPATTSHFGGQTLGGMDDRFDFQLINPSLNDGKGNSYMAGSYHAFGNNGTHTFNGDISTGTGAAPNVLEALEDASDHLPTVAQYQVPAKMDTALASVPSQVIVGATLNAQLSVTNTAGNNTALVVTSAGADKLNYQVTASGAASGSPTGQASALSAANVHSFALSTATAGAKSATFTTTVNNTLSPQVPLSMQTQAHSLNYSVLDHATASFNNSTSTPTLTLNFGSFAVGSGVHDLGFSISNLLATAGYTAPLDFLSFNGTGDTGLLNTNLSTFNNLAAGSSLSYDAAFNATQAGSFSATYDLTLSDDTSLLGALTQHLTLMLTGTGTNATLQGDVNMDGVVNGLDIAQVASNWLATDPGNPGDANGDGVVNGLDIALIAANWLHTSSNPGFGTGTSVPEPSGWLLAVSSVALLFGRRAVRAQKRRG